MQKISEFVDEVKYRFSYAFAQENRKYLYVALAADIIVGGTAGALVFWLLSVFSG